MRFIDTHTHIFSKEFDQDIDTVVAQARKSGVSALMLPDVDRENSVRLWNTVERFPGFCFPMAGLHPGSVKDDYRLELEYVNIIRNTKKIYGIGEIGIDLYWDKTFAVQQFDAFRIQLEWAREMKLPVSVHQRNAMNETLEVLEEFRGDVTGIMHCFSGETIHAAKAIDLGYKLGIGGVVTFKKSNLPEIIHYAGIENIVLETDAPWLAPVPYRGKRNEPAYLHLIIEKVAESAGLSTDIAAEIIFRTSTGLFNIPLD